MNASIRYTLETLFEQLGLDSSEDGIRRFVTEHGPLDSTMVLADAPCWSAAQSTFLSEALERDGAWAVPVEELDVLLH